MNSELTPALERLESLVLSLREQVAELREQVEANHADLRDELAHLDARQYRAAADLGERLLEQRSYWLEVEHTTAPTEPRAR